MRLDQALVNANLQGIVPPREPDGESQALLRQAIDSLGLSARAYNKILKVARTIADLEGGEQIRTHHVSEAVNYRTLDRALE